MDLNALTVESTRTAIAERTLNPVALVEEFYKKIEADDPQIGAYLTLAKDRALTKASAVQALADKGDALPPLAGVPIAIKDVMTIKGVQATAGSKILKGWIAPYTATAVQRLEDAGAIILGKTNCDEFAMGSSNENSGYFPVHNPRDLSRVPGGIVGRKRSGGGGEPGSGCTGIRYWRIDSPARGVLWSGRIAAYLRTRVALWTDRVCVVSRPHWSADEDGERRGHPAALYRRTR